MSNKLRVGIVGYGKMGGIRHQTINARNDAEVVALCDPFADLSGNGDIACYKDWRELLQQPLDAIVVSCTNDLIPTVAVEALNKGRHVFCEKPPGRNVEDVTSIYEASRAKPELILKFGFNHRYHDSVMDAHNLVNSGRMGRLLWMRGTYGKAGGPEYDQNWRNDPDKSGGGILLDQGIHMIDLFHSFCGEFNEVQGMVGCQYWQVPVEDNAFALMRNDAGQVAMLHSSATQWRHTFRLEIYLEKGFLKLEGILSSTMTYGKESLVIARCQYDKSNYPLPNPEETVTYYDHDLSWEREMDEFVTSIHANEPVKVGTVDHALAAMRAVYAIYGADANWSSELSKKVTVG